MGCKTSRRILGRRRVSRSGQWRAFIIERWRSKGARMQGTARGLSEACAVLVAMREGVSAQGKVLQAVKVGSVEGWQHAG